MREKRFISKIVLLVDRITPAYAGKTSSSAALSSFNKDHPRVCGKNV